MIISKITSFFKKSSRFSIRW